MGREEAEEREEDVFKRGRLMEMEKTGNDIVWKDLESKCARVGIVNPRHTKRILID